MTSEHESPAVSDPDAWLNATPELKAAVARARAVPMVKNETNPEVEWVPIRLTPREAAARRLLALGALKKVLDEEIARTRKEDGAAFTMAGQREPAALPDGTPLGLVRADKGTAAGWKITDEPAFRTWVENTCPDAIVVEVVETKKVDPEYADLILKSVPVGLVVDQSTGQVLDGPPPGVTFVKAGPPKLNVTPDKAAPAAVRAYLAPVLAALEVGP